MEGVGQGGVGVDESVGLVWAGGGSGRTDGGAVSRTYLLLEGWG